jgi:hypothetical protein
LPQALQAQFLVVIKNCPARPSLTTIFGDENLSNLTDCNQLYSLVHLILFHPVIKQATSRKANVIFKFFRSRETSTKALRLFNLVLSSFHAPQSL